MPQPIQYFYSSQWLAEGADYQFPSIPFLDEKGMLLSSVTDCWLTLYDAKAAPDVVINSLNHTSIKQTARYKFMTGQFHLTLMKDDLLVTEVPGQIYTRRNALIEYSYGTGGTKTGTQEIHFVIRHTLRFPAVAP